MFACLCLWMMMTSILLSYIIIKHYLRAPNLTRPTFLFYCFPVTILNNINFTELRF